MILIGDSQAEGLAPFFRAAGWTVFDRRGYSTRRLRDEVLPDVRIAPGELVLWISGGNDDPNAALSETVRSSIERLQRAGASVIWTGPVFARVSPDASVHPLVAEIHRAAVRGKSGVRWIDAQSLTRDLARTSNVHLDRAGYAAFAERLQRAAARGSSFALGALALGALALGALAYARGRTRVARVPARTRA
jgi:hypothetical protein